LEVLEVPKYNCPFWISEKKQNFRTPDLLLIKIFKHSTIIEQYAQTENVVYLQKMDKNADNHVLK
jgi:hypothetical protein